MEMLWTATSKNTKTGNIPQGYVGESKEDTLKSCEGCPIIKKCYHHNGTPRMAQASMQRSYKNKPRRYALSNALANSVRTARYVRGAVGGDPSPFPRDVVQGWRDEIKGAGMEGLLLYTHFGTARAHT